MCLKAQNVSLLCKWLWRFKVEADTLWKQVIQALHGFDAGIDSGNGYGKHPSIWRSILKVKKDLQRYNVCLSGLMQCSQSSNGVGVVNWQWTLDNSGLFSAASLSKRACPMRWLDFMPGKVNIMVWRATYHRLPTRKK